MGNYGCPYCSGRRANQEKQILKHYYRKLLLRRKSQKKLDKLELPAEAYASILFDEAELEFAENEIIRLQSVLKIKESDREDASRKEASAGTALANALEEVKRLGAESPLAAQEIKGNII